MPFSFPASPAVNDQSTQNGRTYSWSGYAWEIVATPAALAASVITSGTLDIARIPTGTSSSTVCVGNDARLSDARTPTSHAHGNITNAGAIGSTADQIVVTTTSGVLTAVSAATARTTLSVQPTASPTFTGTVTVPGLTATAAILADDLTTSNSVVYGFDGDTNTGVGRAGADILTIVTNGTERVRVDASGNVGIGTQSPDSLLSISGSNTGGALNALSLNNTPDTAGNGAQIRFLQAGNLTNFIKTNFVNSTWTLSFGTTSEQMRLQGGELIVGTTDQGAYNLQCNGTGVWGAGAYVNGSDERIKDDIAPLPSCTDVIESLRPVTFRYKESWSKDQSIQPGFIAQDLQQALAGQPYLDGVVQQGTEYLSVAYQTLIPLLVKALQESNARIAALEERLSNA